MGLKVYGAVAVQTPDSEGEIIDVAGIDTSDFRYINDEHGDKMFDFIGIITSHKKILTREDAITDKQRKIWNLLNTPFLYAEGELANEDHPNAQAAAALLRFTQSRPDVPLKLGWSIEGGILERLDRNGKPDEEGKYLKSTVATGGTITVKPCNKKALLFAETDLNKSNIPQVLPERYKEALVKSKMTPSVKEVRKELLELKLKQLKKSLEDFYGKVTHLKCSNCAKKHTFFKSGDVPNSCPHCGGRFRLSELYKALSK